MKTICQNEPAFQEKLKAAGLMRFVDFMAIRGGDPAGWHAHRETVPLEVRVGGERYAFYLKRVFCVPPKHAFWPLIRGRLGRSQPWREWHMLAALQSSGIGAMRRVAFGERRRWGMPREAFLLVERVPAEWHLGNWVVPGYPAAPALSSQDRSRLAYEVGRMLGALCRGGFNWPDLHPKHIYAARQDAPFRSRWRLYLIDVERMTRRSAPLNANEAIAEVRRLAARMQPMPIDRTLVRRLAAGYRAGVGRNVFEQLQREGATRLSLRSVVNCADLPRLPDDFEHPAARTMLVREAMRVAEADAEAMDGLGLSSLDDVLRYGGGANLTKPGLAAHRDRIRLACSQDSSTKVYYLKRYRMPPLREQLRRMREWRVGRGTARREIAYADRLAELGIPTMRPVAYGERMSGWWERASFAVAAEVPGTSLERIAAAVMDDPSTAPTIWERREIARQLGLIVRRLHEHDLFHRDLYLSHVFVARNADGEPVLFLIDLARMIERPRYLHRWRVKDLAALDYSTPPTCATRADRVRFLYDYLRVAARPAERRAARQRVRRMIAQILARSQRMRRHDIRRGRATKGTSSA